MKGFTHDGLDNLCVTFKFKWNPSLSSSTTAENRSKEIKFTCSYLTTVQHLQTLSWLCEQRVFTEHTAFLTGPLMADSAQANEGDGGDATNSTHFRYFMLQGPLPMAAPAAAAATSARTRTSGSCPGSRFPAGWSCCFPTRTTTQQSSNGKTGDEDHINEWLFYSQEDSVHLSVNCKTVTSFLKQKKREKVLSPRVFTFWHTFFTFLRIILTARNSWKLSRNRNRTFKSQTSSCKSREEENAQHTCSN